MIRSILLALDASPSSASAQDLAVAVARRSNAEISALAIVDSPWLTRGEAVPIGGAAYKFESDLARLKDAHVRIAAAIERFETLARQAGIAHESEPVDGHPAELIEARSTEHDLVVLGRDMDFHFDDDAAVPAALEQLARDCPRPLLISPRQAAKGKSILVAFDGSIASSRAVHMLALTGLARERTVNVLSVDAVSELAQARAEQACLLLNRHGAKAKALGIASNASPDDIILSHAQSLDAGVIAMGAYGHRGVRELLVGSCTRHLITTCPTALFVYH